METENKRLMSLDALRGADMLFITGLRKTVHYFFATGA